MENFLTLRGLYSERRVTENGSRVNHCRGVNEGQLVA